MSDTPVLGTRDIGSLWIAAFFGWVAAVLFGLVVFLIGVLLTSPPSFPAAIGEMLWKTLAAIFGLWLAGSILSFPAPILAAMTLSVAERISLHTRRLPVWLVTGVAASIPTASYVWFGFTSMAAHDDGTFIAKPYLWTNFRVPLLILACGVVGAVIAWRWRQARLAR